MRLHPMHAITRPLGLALVGLLCAGAAQANLDPPPGTDYPTWDTPESAIQALWQARITYNQRWAWGMTSKQVPQQVLDNIEKGRGLGTGKPPQRTSDSIYLIPKVGIRSGKLPRALHHVAAALLSYRLDAINIAFYPSYTDVEVGAQLYTSQYALISDYPEYFWQETRSRHDDEMMYLPAVPTPQCPAVVGQTVVTAWNAGTPQVPAKQSVMTALAGPPMAGYANAVKWHCLAMRAAPPGSTVLDKAFGYIEFSEPDADTSKREYRHSDQGRIVYDYVRGRVYYTPSHYRPSYYDGTELKVSNDNTCPEGRVCASPFFEIVE